jgi:hypothetical protein
MIVSRSGTMKRDVIFKISGIAILLIITFHSGCSKKTQPESGYLNGTISIGPICPVETIPPDPGCLPTAETYKAFPVSIFTGDGKTQITQLSPSLNGYFINELHTGNYLIKLERDQNNIGGSNLPVEVTITSGDTTLLDISIDTGIR